jgi:hypothetical protein
MIRFFISFVILIIISQLTTLMAEREQAFRTGGAELRVKEDEFIRSKKGLEKEMEQLKREIRVDLGQTTKLHGRDKELKNMEVSRTKSHILDTLLSNRPYIGSCYMFNMPQWSTNYDHH